MFVTCFGLGCGQASGVLIQTLPLDIVDHLRYFVSIVKALCPKRNQVAETKQEFRLG
jgi:hypothetical protein